MPRLLADEFFLVAHDDITGRCRLASGIVGLGLAGALLGELVLFGKIDVERGTVVVVDRRPPPDGLTHTVLEQVAGERSVLGVREWLQYLAQRSYDDVGQRLERAGCLRSRQVRRLLRSTVVYEAVDLNIVAQPLALLTAKLGARQSFALPEAVLAGLIAATGLDTYVLRDADPAARDRLRREFGALPRPLAELTRQTEAVVGDAVLTPRR